MEINPPQNPQIPSKLSTSTVENLNLKLNQQLEVKVLSSQLETQTLLLKSIASNKPLPVKSNLPVAIQPGQTFQLLVTKLNPVAEFKVLATQPEINFSNKNNSQNSSQLFSIKDLVFRQIIPAPINTLIKSPLPIIKPVLISATVIEVSQTQIKLQLPENKLLPFPFFKSLPENNLLSEKNQQTLFPSIITLNKSQLDSSSKVLNQLTDSKPIPVDLQTLVKGQLIKLEVVNSNNQTEFKLIPIEITAEQKIRETFKKLLPVQQQPEVLLNQIINNLKVISKNQTIPETLKQLAREILQTLPQAKNLQNPLELKKYIRGSGVFLEAKITKLVEESEQNIKQDLKNQFLKFNHALKQTFSLISTTKNTEQKEITNDLNLIKELQQKTENTLAKIILNQLSSLPKEEGTRQVWILDLPFIHKEIADSVSIEINRQPQNEENPKSENWTVTISVTPPDMDTIHCNISCFDKTINTRFWSDNEGMVSTINKQLDYLKTQFEKAGIMPGHMSVQSGKPKTSRSYSDMDLGLFDQKA